ncbi:MAG: GNAT family protein [Deltaproteobacteria bacterium]|nr:GNAT family protein [Deltaproteobacteria bacterium]
MLPQPREIPKPHLAEDGRVRIRPYREDDVEPIYEAIAASKVEIMRWLPWCHPEYGIEETRAWVESRPGAWESGDEFSFVVEEPSTGRILGANGIHGAFRSRLVGGLGYWMRTDHAGQGLTTAASRLTLRFGFEVLGLHRIEILAKTGNLASRRVAEKLGATYEGVLRDRLFYGGRSHDAACYSLLPGEL